MLGQKCKISTQFNEGRQVLEETREDNWRSMDG